MVRPKVFMTFRHNTEIGQNFLIDRSVAVWMTERARLSSADRILEIGAGDGILTKSILASGCARVDALEIDVRMKERLEPFAASDDRLRLHWSDAVKFDYSTLDETPTHVIANLPYHITTPLLWKLLEFFSGSNMRYMLLMIQDEAVTHRRGRGEEGIQPALGDDSGRGRCGRAQESIPHGILPPAESGFGDSGDNAAEQRQSAHPPAP